MAMGEMLSIGHGMRQLQNVTSCTMFGCMTILPNVRIDARDLGVTIQSLYVWAWICIQQQQREKKDKLHKPTMTKGLVTPVPRVGIHNNNDAKPCDWHTKAGQDVIPARGNVTLAE